MIGKEKRKGSVVLGTYVMSDIHGCYKEFLAMLNKIGFSKTDQLILAGDYIDRGRQSYEMLRWMEYCPENICLVRGNHDEEFAAYVDLMIQIDKTGELKSDFHSNYDAVVLYESTKYALKNIKSTSVFFDLYGTIGTLLMDSKVTLEDLCRWAEIVRKMPYYYEQNIKNRDCIVVHAGYAEEFKDVCSLFSSLEEFYLWARKESHLLGGKRHGMVIAGHTPTIIKNEFTYNRGRVFRYYDKEKDCIFYNIDCGCVFRRQTLHARLACIRLEDEKVFYI